MPTQSQDVVEKIPPIVAYLNVAPTTRLRMRQFVLDNHFRNYDEALRALLERAEENTA